MNWLYPLRRILPLALLIFSLPLLLLLHLLQLHHADQDIRLRLSQRAAHSGNQLSILLRDALSEENWEAARRTLQSVATQPDLRWAALLDETGTPLLSTDYRQLQGSGTELSGASIKDMLTTARRTLAGQSGFSADGTLYAVFPLRLPLAQGELRARRIGALVFSYDSGELRATARHEALQRSALSFAGAAVIAGLFWLYLHLFLVQRIERLAAALQGWRGHPDELPRIGGRDEIAQLAHQFGRLTHTLAERNRELQQAEQYSKRLSAFYATLSHTNTAIVRSGTLAELLPRICDIAVENSGLKGAWIGFVNPATLEIQPAASSGMPADYLSALRLSLDATAPQGQGPTATAIRQGEHYLCNDFLGDPQTAAWHERAGKAGFLASAAFPLRRDGKVVGALNLYAGVANLFSDDLVRLLDEMALDISFALDNFLREEQRQQAEEALARRSHELRERVKELRCLLDASEIIAQHDLTADEMLRRIVARIPPAMQYPEQSWARITLDGREYTCGEAAGASISAPITLQGRRLGTIEAGYRIPAATAPTDMFMPEEQTLLAMLAEQIGHLHARQQADEQLHMAALVFDNSRELIVITDADAHIVSVNRAFTKVTGYSADEVVGQHIRAIKSGRQDQPFYEELWKSVVESGYWQGELWNRRKSGEIYPALASISAVHDAQGKVTRYISVSTDITEYKQAEDRIRYLAYYDPLTELPNRTLLRDRAEQALNQAERAGTTAALLFLDLDHFKTINDSLGHLCGDALLQEVTQRIQAVLRHTDTVGRLGGDEFLIVLGGSNATAAAHVAHSLISRISQPFAAEGHTLTVSASIGIALYPADGGNFDELHKNADIAMYKAKELGRNRYHFFTPELNSAAMERLTLENALRGALDGDQFTLHYQPQIDLASGQVIGVEALLRWTHPELGAISPARFIPIAEESGLIGRIGAWVLHEACRQNKAWQAQGLPMMVVAVNVSTRQFSLGDIRELVQQALADTGLEPDYLEVEITESLLAQDMENTLAVLRHIHTLGVQIAVDDFGTGYSSLAYLKRFPLHKLKLDQSFVRDLEQDADDRAIASGVVNLGHSLGLTVIAEGVESEAQFDILRRLGCDEVQGYLFSRPLPAADLAAWLRQRSTHG